MKNVNDYYYVCEEGHLTVGNSSAIKKCPAKNYDCKFVWKKEGRKKFVDVDKKENGTCGAVLVELNKMPESITYNQVWDPKILRAFLIGQKMGEEFINGIQEEFVRLHKRIDKLEGVNNE